MLRAVKELEGFAVRALDGTIGHVRDLYFDDKTWAARYLIVETGSWLSSRRVLISPIAIDRPDWTRRVLPVSITKEQVKNSPDIDTHKPVSRQHEMQYFGYYGYPYYWAGDGLWGLGHYPSTVLEVLCEGGSDATYRHVRVADVRTEAYDRQSQSGDPHLRSCNALMDYRIEAIDGSMGHVQGLVFDEDSWAIRYIIVNTGHWWLGHHVLIAPSWIKNISWPDATVCVNVTQQVVKAAPVYDSEAPPSRDQEVALYAHHGHTGYWEDEPKLKSLQHGTRDERPSV